MNFWTKNEDFEQCDVLSIVKLHVNKISRVFPDFIQKIIVMNWQKKYRQNESSRILWTINVKQSFTNFLGTLQKFSTWSLSMKNSSNWIQFCIVKLCVNKFSRILELTKKNLVKKKEVLNCELQCKQNERSSVMSSFNINKVSWIASWLLSKKFVKMKGVLHSVAWM